jgi:hypothetical protein
LYLKLDAGALGKVRGGPAALVLLLLITELYFHNRLFLELQK